jgi:hypothetical protein
VSDSPRVHLTGLVLVLGLAASLAVADDRPGGAATAGATTAGATTLVVCAPGYPGSTAEAQSAMDAFAEVVAAGAGWKPGDLQAVYFETEKPGVDRLAAPDAALALVALPFWLQHRAALKLTARLQAVEEGGQAAEAWTLVAPAGAVSGPPSLAGFELVTIAGYAPRFIRGPVLGPWGELPTDVRIVASNNVLSAMRRASVGNKVAVLLARASAAALATLPFASKLQVVTRSTPLPVAVLSVVGDRVSAAKLAALLKGLMSLETTPGGKQALAGVRLTRFVAADQEALTRARELFDRAKE